MPPFIRDLIPAKARQAVYSILAAAWALEGIFDVVSEGAQGRIAAVLAVLGFGLAAGNVSTK